MKLSLRHRFLLPTILLIVSGVCLSAGLCGMVFRQALTNAINAELEQVRALTNSRITTYFQDRKTEVQSWGRSKLLAVAIREAEAGKPAMPAAMEFVAACRSQSGYYENVALVDPRGEVIAAAIQDAVGRVKVADREYFREAMNDKTAVSNSMISRTSGNPVFNIAVPVKNENRVIGVFYASVNLPAFNEIFIDPVKVGTEGRTFMFGRDGALISHPDKSLIQKTNLRDQEFSKQIAAMSEGTIRYADHGKKWITGFQINKDSGWLLCVAASEDEVLAPIKRLYYIAALCALGISMVAAFVIILISGYTIRPLNALALKLKDGADHVASASGQLSEASNELAEGASEQAASIEEISSSLEEISSMTKHSAQSAGVADELTQRTTTCAASAKESLTRLSVSIEEISRASEESTRIIKTIDAIAFQTNLLALNAAVEAARAGAAGSGFAVVADEVRSLALRSAEAAKGTADLLEGMVGRIKEGAMLVEETSSEFDEVAESAEKIRKLIGEVAAASREQSEGIEQVNRAIGDMDKIVQQDAAHAEEVASASLGMDSQAGSMKSFVEQLDLLVGCTAKEYHATKPDAKALPGKTAKDNPRQPAAGYAACSKRPDEPSIHLPVKQSRPQPPLSGNNGRLEL